MLNQFLNSIADAGRELWSRGANDKHPDTLKTLCDDLLSTRGEASGIAVARDVAHAYEKLDAEGRLSLFNLLLEEYPVDREEIAAAAQAYRTDDSAENYARLGRAVEPRRLEFFRRLNMAPGGTATIVGMRADLRRIVRENPGLKPLDEDLKGILKSWFNRGFLTLRQIDWHTPADILERLIQYEAVHRMDGWDDLRRRLAPDRRCFAFFHPALPDEPLIFVEVALVNGLATAVTPLLDRTVDQGDAHAADTAIFYSISNCQEGLAGISFGNFLIKQVVHELKRDLPGLKTFATLSPIPGFRRWLEAELANSDSEFVGAQVAEQLVALDMEEWEKDERTVARLKPLLMQLCARYLASAKSRGRPADPVTRFHIGNGARLEQLNWMGDPSPNGLRQSYGMLVNYLYDLKTIERNHEDFAESGKIAMSSQVRKLL